MIDVSQEPTVLGPVAVGTASLADGFERDPTRQPHLGHFRNDVVSLDIALPKHAWCRGSLTCSLDLGDHMRNLRGRGCQAD